MNTLHLQYKTININLNIYARLLFYVSTDLCMMIMMIPIGSQAATTPLSALTQI